MLYPLSYEGLLYAFAQHAGECRSVGAGAGCLAPDGLCRTCAACRERLVSTASTRGADCTAGGVELRVAVPAATAGCRAFRHGAVGGIRLSAPTTAAAGTARAPL